MNVRLKPLKFRPPEASPEAVNRPDKANALESGRLARHSLAFDWVDAQNPRCVLRYFRETANIFCSASIFPCWQVSPIRSMTIAKAQARKIAAA